MKGLVIIKKIGIFMSLLMGFTLSLVMSLVGTLTSGHFTVGSWLISFGISFVISMIIGLIVPMPKLEAAACAKFRLKPHTFPANALSALISNTIYTPLMSVVMVLIMVGSANAGIQNGIDALTKQIGAASSELSVRVEPVQGLRIHQRNRINREGICSPFVFEPRLVPHKVVWGKNVDSIVHQFRPVTRMVIVRVADDTSVQLSEVVCHRLNESAVRHAALN